METWGEYRNVPLIYKHHKICNVTYKGQLMTLTWGQLKYYSIRFDETNKMVPLFLLHISKWKLFEKNDSAQKCPFDLVTSGA